MDEVTRDFIRICHSKGSSKARVPLDEWMKLSSEDHQRILGKSVSWEIQMEAYKEAIEEHRIRHNLPVTTKEEMNAFERLFKRQIEYQKKR